jgi:AbrB family looped-hinge helix DNA binding protein
MKKPPFLHGMTTIGERGQIVIPHEIRQALRMKAGDEMVVFLQGGKIIILPSKSLETFYKTVLGRLEHFRKTTKRVSSK